MSNYDKTLDFAVSEAAKFIKEIKTPELRDNVRYLMMALKLLEEELDEKSKKRSCVPGLGEIIERDPKDKQEKDQEKAASFSRRCASKNAG